MVKKALINIFYFFKTKCARTVIGGGRGEEAENVSNRDFRYWRSTILAKERLV